MGLPILGHGFGGEVSGDSVVVRRRGAYGSGLLHALSTHSYFRTTATVRMSQLQRVQLNTTEGSDAPVTRVVPREASGACACAVRHAPRATQEHHAALSAASLPPLAAGSSRRARGDRRRRVRVCVVLRLPLCTIDQHAPAVTRTTKPRTSSHAQRRDGAGADHPAYTPGICYDRRLLASR